MSMNEQVLHERIEHCLSALDDTARESTSIGAVVEAGLLSAEERAEVRKRFQGHAWLQQPEYSALQPLGPWLFAADVDTLLNDLYPLAERGFHGLLMTHQPVAHEAEKLGELCVVKDTAGDKQLLRYYAPHVLPIVHRFSDMPWHQRLFGSLSYWWLPGLEGWREYKGRWHSQGEVPDASETITLTPALLQALGNDPLSHQILGELEQSSPSLFSVACPGIRLAIVDKAISRARKAGLSSTQNLSVYAAYCVAHGMEVSCEPAFARAVELARAGPHSLAENLKTTGSHSISEARHG